MSPRPGFVWRLRPRIPLGILVAVYLLVLGAEPFLHHSAACHANTPTHCTACAMQTTSPDVADDLPSRHAIVLPDAGTLVPYVRPHDATPFVSRTNDRSPPA